MSIELIDNPLITSLEDDLMGAFGLFPAEVYVISMGDDKYACNNATLTDGTTVDGLAVFPTETDVQIYENLLAGLHGTPKMIKFEEAREIAKSKPRLQSLLLFQMGRIVEVHFIR